MMAPMRYVVVIVLVIITLHTILSFSHTEYGRATSISHLKEKFSSQPRPRPEQETQIAPDKFPRKANATFVILARNHEVQGVLESMKQMEDRFNKGYNYPYVFLNDELFNEDFKQRTTEVTSSQTFYGLIPKNHWHQPSHIDENKAAAARAKMAADRVIYGGSLPYRNMCRFNSGFFFRHELLQNYRYYWRIEPGVKYYCDLDYDPFLIMQDQKKVYGFTISLYEYIETIPTLWDATKEFIKENPDLLPKDNAMQFISDDNGDTYNRCHFWSNFEIGDMNFWRGEAYMKYFEHLEKKGGFYYERWGDAPVHSIGASLFASKDQIHFFQDIGYYHGPFTHCPTGGDHLKGKCWCNERESFTYHSYSCTSKFEAMF